MFSGLQVKTCVSEDKKKENDVKEKTDKDIDPIEQAKLLARRKTVSTKKPRKKKGVKSNPSILSFGNPSNSSTNVEKQTTSSRNTGGSSSMFGNLTVKKIQSNEDSIPVPEPLPHVVEVLMEPLSTEYTSSKDKMKNEVEELDVKDDIENDNIVMNPDLQSISFTDESYEETEDNGSAFSFLNEEDDDGVNEDGIDSNDEVTIKFDDNDDSVPSKLEKYRLLMEKELNEISKKDKEIRNAQESVIEKKKELNKKLNEIRVKIRSLTNQEAEASQNENFILATELQEEITSTKSLLQETEKEYTITQETSSKNQELARIYSEARIDILKKYIVYIDTLYKNINNEKEETLESLETELAREQMRASKQSKEIEEEKEKISMEEQEINEKYESTMEQIKSHSENLFEEKNQWKSKENELKTEIEQLMSLLQVKQQEHQRVQEEITRLDQQIKENSKPFNESLRFHNVSQQLIEEKKESIQQSLEKLNEITQSAEMYKELLHNTAEEFNEDIIHIQDYKKLVSNQLTAYTHHSDMKNSTIKYLQDWDNQLSKVQDEYETKEKEKDFVEKEIAALCDTEITSRKELGKVQRKISETNDNIQQHTENKKLAIAARNFKEAGRLTEEIKQCTETLESLDIKEKGLHVTIDKSKEAITTRKEQLIILKKEVESLLFKYNSKRIEGLTAKSVQLKQLLSEDNLNSDEIPFLRLLLQECEFELSTIQKDISDSVNSDTLIEEEKEEQEEEDNIVPENSSNIKKNNQLQQKADLREQISSLENRIMSLVDQDMFEEADELEQERVKLEAILNSL